MCSNQINQMKYENSILQYQCIIFTVLLHLYEQINRTTLRLISNVKIWKKYWEKGGSSELLEKRSEGKRGIKAYTYTSQLLSYHFQPFGTFKRFLYTFIGEHWKRENKCLPFVAKSSKITIQSMYCMLQPSLHLFCSFNSIINYGAMWYRTESLLTKRLRAKLTFFVRLYGFVFVCRFQLNSDCKLTFLLQPFIVITLSCCEYHVRTEVYEINIRCRTNHGK